MQKIIVNGIEYRFFNHLFAVSRNGELLRQLQPYTPTNHPMGYKYAGRRRLVHRMVAICWLEKPEGANHVHHKNGIKSDNRAANLEWVSPKEHLNERHTHRVGDYERTDEVRQKLRNFRLGRKTSEETKQKQREASIRLGCTPPPRPVGFKCSPESVAKMRANNPMNTACEVAGVMYDSFADASRATGIKLHTIRKRCLSQNFPTYKLWSK